MDFFIVQINTWIEIFKPFYVLYSIIQLHLLTVSKQKSP